MSTKATLGQGTTLQRGNGAGPEVFATLAEVKDLKITQSSPRKDVTNMDSAAGYREFIADLVDASMDVTLNFADATAYGTLLTDQQGQVKHNYKVVFPASVGHTLAFAAIITKLEIQDPAADVITLAASFQITGAITES